MSTTTTSLTLFTLSLWTSPSSSSSSSYSIPLLVNRTPNLSQPHIKRGVVRRHGLVTLNCVSERRNQASETESETTPSSSASTSSSSSSGFNGGVIDDANERDISAYRWCAALGGVGLVETAYLTYLKLTGSEAFCPVGEGSCNTILTSDFSSVFGVPLPLFGMIAYGCVAFLGIQLSEKEMTFDPVRTDGEVTLVALTTSMAVASAYFLYILNTEFNGETCLFCLASATLSFSLFFISLKTFGFKELQKLLGLQLTIASLVVIALTASYNTAQSDSSLLETELPYVEIEITNESSPFAIALAKYLHSIGAKLYGAFWCSHCQDQKEVIFSLLYCFFHFRSDFSSHVFLYFLLAFVG